MSLQRAGTLGRGEGVLTAERRVRELMLGHAE